MQKVTQESIRAQYQSMSTDDLLEKIHGGTLTMMAHTVALDILNERKIPINELPAHPITNAGNLGIEAITGNYIKSAWQGKVSLVSAFWPTLLVLGFLNLASLTLPKDITIALLYFIFIQAPVLVFWWASVWRCAFRTTSWIYSILARLVVFISIFSIIMHLV